MTTRITSDVIRCLTSLTCTVTIRGSRVSRLCSTAKVVSMGEGIDLPSLAKASGVPHSTLRYWAGEHRIRPVSRRRGLAFYAVKDFKPYLLAWKERQQEAA